jgi:hypothetical protein
MRAGAALICVLLTALCVSPVAFTEGRRDNRPPTELWKAFPLRPIGTQQPRPSTEGRAPRQPVVPAATTPTARPQGNDGSGSSRSGAVLAAILVVLVLTLALAASAARHGGVRSFRPRALAGPRKGGSMSRKLRLLRGPERVAAEGTAPSRPAVSDPLERLKSYGVEGSKAMETQPAKPPAQREPQSESAPQSYRELGEQVATVLQSAQDAAAEMKRAAEEEADRIRRAAERAAEAATKEATQKVEEDRRALEELRSEAERHSQKVREAADLHADQKRKEAEEEAERTRAEAHEEARQIEEAATLRRASLVDEARTVQEWLDKALLAFRDVTTRLEGLASGTPTPPEDRVLDTALSDRIYAKTR